MTLRFRRSLYSAAMGVVVVVGVRLYVLWLFSFTTANGTTYQGIPELPPNSEMMVTVAAACPVSIRLRWALHSF